MTDKNNPDNLITDYFTGELSAENQQELKAQIQCEPNVAHDLAQSQQLSDLLKQALNSEPDYSLTENQLANIMNHAQKQQESQDDLNSLKKAASIRGFTLIDQRPRDFKISAWLNMSAAALVGICIGIGLYAGSVMMSSKPAESGFAPVTNYSGIMNFAAPTGNLPADDLPAPTDDEENDADSENKNSKQNHEDSLIRIKG